VNQRYKITSSKNKYWGLLKSTWKKTRDDLVIMLWIFQIRKHNSNRSTSMTKRKPNHKTEFSRSFVQCIYWCITIAVGATWVQLLMDQCAAFKAFSISDLNLIAANSKRQHKRTGWKWSQKIAYSREESSGEQLCSNLGCIPYALPPAKIQTAEEQQQDKCEEDGSYKDEGLV